ncbi:MAG: CaiB/BaiF CoA transferase family protein [Gammaproteobacteria bacterium]
MSGSVTSSACLSGILVVAVEQAVAAPLCTSRLAAAGARVIKIERRGGDFARNYDAAAKGQSSYFVWLNQGKESLQLDLKTDDDLQLLKNIISKADVFVQNLAPGATQRLGLGSEALRDEFPRLVTCDISGYGESGPLHDMKAYDFLVQCETGLVSITGSPGAVGRVGVSVCDIGTGMNAVIGIQQALFERTRTGRGRGVSVSLFDTLADWMNVPAIHERYGQGAPPPAGLSHPSVAPYGCFVSADQLQIAISVQNEREWQAFCRHFLEDTELGEDERYASNNLRVANRAPLDATIQAFFATLDAQALCTKLKKSGIAYGRVNSVEALWQHPQLQQREVRLSNGECVKVIDWPVRMVADTQEPVTYVAAPGEHDERLRSEFGLKKS